MMIRSASIMNFVMFSTPFWRPMLHTTVVISMTMSMALIRMDGLFIISLNVSATSCVSALTNVPFAISQA